MIILVWKNIGQSTHQLAKKIGKITSDKTNKQEDSKATHTGTLDPMAEGIVVVLTGDDRYKKTEFSNWKKEYEFSIIFGIDTDSNDLLGLQAKITDNPLDVNTIQESLKNLLPNFTGKFEQTQPNFSAQRIKGESAFDKAKKGEYIVAKKNYITISSIEILNSNTISTKYLLTAIKNKIKLVSGDFRQKKIIKNWQETIKKLEQNKINNLPLIHLKTNVSKRTYIRSLVRDISTKLNIPATTFSITRTKNGIFSKENCF
jgi:tRNA pseudouridine55 synthase